MQDDEDEHSLEMHFPWIAYTFGVNVKIVPILVGHVTTQTAHKFGKIFAEYLKDPSTFMVISSDFCHWGKRFAYTFYDPNWGPIYKSIEKLDRTGMEAIASLEVETYYAYQKKYKNTICGRNPILILLGAVTASLNKYEMKFVHYSQSSKVVDSNDSSVSYAAGVLYEM
jgi:AmmeMemoRadiSam system protein B